MGTLFRAWKTIPMPTGATIKRNIVTWTVRGKKRTGKLSRSGKQGKIEFSLDISKRHGTVETSFVIVSNAESQKAVVVTVTANVLTGEQ
jgi:hypothetical protein